MVSKAALSIFILRTLSLVASLISVAIVPSSHHFLLFGNRYGYKDFVTFRYVMAVAVMSLVYGVVQLLFGAYYAFKHKRFIPPHFEFYADQVMSVLLATGSVAGIAVCHENTVGVRGVRDRDDDVRRFMKQYSKFWDKLLAASVFLFLAWLCLAVVSMLSYHRNINDKNPILSSTHNQSKTFEPSPKEPDAQHTHISVPTDEHVKPTSDDVSSV